MNKSQYDNIIKDRNRSQQLFDQSKDTVLNIQETFKNVGETMSTVQLYKLAESLLFALENMIELHDEQRQSFNLLLTSYKWETAHKQEATDDN